MSQSHENLQTLEKKDFKLFYEKISRYYGCKNADLAELLKSIREGYFKYLQSEVATPPVKLKLLNEIKLLSQYPEIFDHEFTPDFIQRIRKDIANDAKALQVAIPFEKRNPFLIELVQAHLQFLNDKKTNEEFDHAFSNAEKTSDTFAAIDRVIRDFIKYVYAWGADLVKSAKFKEAATVFHITLNAVDRLSEKLDEEDTAPLLIRTDLFYALWERAQRLQDSDNPNDLKTAIELYQEASELKTGIIIIEADANKYQTNLWKALNKYAEVLFAEGKIEECIQTQQAAITECQKITEKNEEHLKDVQSLQRNLFSHLINIADFHNSQNQFSKAIARYREACELYQNDKKVTTTEMIKHTFKGFVSAIQKVTMAYQHLPENKRNEAKAKKRLAIASTQLFLTRLMFEFFKAEQIKQLSTYNHISQLLWSALIDLTLISEKITDEKQRKILKQHVEEAKQQLLELIKYRHKFAIFELEAPYVAFNAVEISYEEMQKFTSIPAEFKSDIDKLIHYFLLLECHNYLLETAQQEELIRLKEMHFEMLLNVINDDAITFQLKKGGPVGTAKTLLKKIISQAEKSDNSAICFNVLAYRRLSHGDIKGAYKYLSKGSVIMLEQLLKRIDKEFPDAIFQLMELCLDKSKTSLNLLSVIKTIWDTKQSNTAYNKYATQLDQRLNSQEDLGVGMAASAVKIGIFSPKVKSDVDVPKAGISFSSIK